VTISTVLSVLAVAAAGLSVGYTHRQAQHAAKQVDAARKQVAESRKQSKYLRRQLTLELATRYEKERPTLTGHIAAVDGGRCCRLWVELVAGKPLTGLAVTLPDRSGVAFSRSQGSETSAEMTEWAGAMQVGDKVSRRVDLADDRAEAMTITVDARRGDEVWQVPVQVGIPVRCSKTSR
jgi:hypothetical protein